MTTQKRHLSEFAHDPMGMDAGPEVGMGPELDAMPAEPEGAEVIGQHNEGPDREGAMAKADLYKLASYSHKLYQQIKDEDQLEAWVQAKITKAADYIASVYHYLEYEMKFSEYGKHLDNADTLSESQKEVLKARLNEAREMVKQLKVQQAEKVSEATKTPSTWTDKSGKKHPATSVKGDKYTGKDAEKETKTKDVDEGFDKGSKEGDTFKTATGGTATKTKTGVKHTAGKNYTGKGAEKESKPNDKDLDEATKTPSTWTDKSGKKHPATSVKGDKYTGKDAEKETKSKELDEAKPSAGLSKAKKSATVKDAKAGKDIGKSGKNFDKVAKSAGGGKKGEKIAAAAMWKNIKETVKSKQADKDYDGDGKIESGKDEHAGSVDKAIKASKKETVKESTDFTRMQDQLNRLNRNETHQLVESSDADKIRALTKRLLG